MTLNVHAVGDSMRQSQYREALTARCPQLQAVLVVKSDIFSLIVDASSFTELRQVPPYESASQRGPENNASQLESLENALKMGAP